MAKQSLGVSLLATEELSISRTTKRVYVTQQCVSDHIERLEEEYGAPLFKRKPNLRLTEAGEAMLKVPRSVHVSEDNMERNIHEIADGHRDAFVVGISTSRVQVVLPPMLKRYCEHFPKIDVSSYVSDTVTLEGKLLGGTTDSLLGTNTPLNSVFYTILLAINHMHLITSGSLFQQHLDSRKMKEFEQDIDLSCFSEVPLSLYYEAGAANLMIQQCLKDYGIHSSNILYHISDCDTHILSYVSGLYAVLIPEMLSLRTYEYSAKCDPDKCVHIFPVKNFQHPPRIELI